MCDCGECGFQLCKCLSLSLQVKRYELEAHYLTRKHQALLLRIVDRYLGRCTHRLSPHDCDVVQDTVIDVCSAVDAIANDQERLRGEEKIIHRKLEKTEQSVQEFKRSQKAHEESVETICKAQQQTEEQLTHFSQGPSKGHDTLFLDRNSMVTLTFSFCATEPAASISAQSSPRFRTCPSGYDFVLGVSSTMYSGQEYLSVSLTLLRSAHTGILIYPFPYHIYIILWDQSHGQQHLVHKLTPNPDSTSFARPTCEKNDAHIIHQFCLLADLVDKKRAHVGDGKFFIRVFIDFLNTGKIPFQPMANQARMQVG